MSNPGKEMGDGGATAEPVNLLLLLEDQISKCTFLKEMNRCNERGPNLIFLKHEGEASSCCCSLCVNS